MISANGGLPAHRYTPQVTPGWPRGSEPASVGPHHYWRRAWWALVVSWFAGPGGVGRLWCRGRSGQRVLMVRGVWLMVLSMSAVSGVAGVARGDVEGQVGVADDAAGAWRRRW